MKSSRVFKGADLKLNLHIDPIGDLSMENYDWTASFYCESESPIEVNRKQAKKIDSNNYIITLNTSNLSTGMLKCTIEADIPDADFKDDNTRKEIVKLNTGIIIVE